MEIRFKIMSQKTPLLSEVLSGDRIPEYKLAYFEQRAVNSFYDFVIKRFEEEKINSRLTKAKLAYRIGRGQDQVNRWLASPGNWTIGTAARLLVGICAEEPVLGSRSLAGRVPQNTSTMSFLDDENTATDEIIHLSIPPSATTTEVVKVRAIESAPA
jgi:hypothetical protein